MTVMYDDGTSNEKTIIYGSYIATTSTVECGSYTRKTGGKRYGVIKIHTNLDSNKRDAFDYFGRFLGVS